MKTSQMNDRRPRKPSFAPERLESRELMTGGVGDTFAIMPAKIVTAGGHTTAQFLLNPNLFTDPGHKPFVLGIDVAPNQGSAVNPIIRSVTTPSGKSLSVTHATFNPKITRTGPQAASGLSSGALVTIPGLPAADAKSILYKVNIDALDKTSGSVLVGFYLPGDANGDGIVNQSDINAIRYGLNTAANDHTGKYAFDADANRDGLLNGKDLAIAQKNLGVGTTISPVISAKLDQASVTDATHRITSHPTVGVTGTATPYSIITYTMPTQAPTTVVASGAGTYNVMLNLKPGANIYSVATADAFGQKIAGSINSITYDPAARPSTTLAAPAQHFTPPPSV